MDFKQLKTFRSAARTLNFSETAQLLGYVQSAVTGHIKTLERDLGVKLFDRSGRNVTLTHQGVTLLQHADQLFSMRDQAIQTLSPEAPKNLEILIGGYESICTYILPPIFKEFRDLNPVANVRFSALPVKDLKNKILNHDIHLAFMYEDASLTSEFDYIDFGPQEVVLLSSPSHRLAKLEEVSDADLRRETVLFTEPGCIYRNKFEKLLIDAGAYPSSRYEFVSVEAIKACLKLEMGVAALSKLAVEKDLATAELVQLPWKRGSLNVRLRLVWKANRKLPKHVRDFIRHTEACITSRNFLCHE